jgi:hypothetical protein
VFATQVGSRQRAATGQSLGLEQHPGCALADVTHVLWMHATFWQALATQGSVLLEQHPAADDGVDSQSWLPPSPATQTSVVQALPSSQVVTSQLAQLPSHA